MPQYQYQALSESGVIIAGKTVSASPEQLAVELAGRGLRAQRIVLKRDLIRFWQSNRVKPEEFILFVQEMISLLRAGLPLPEVLALASDRPASPVLGQVIVQVLQNVREGMLLSQACEKHADVFDALFLAALRIGEKSGELPAVLTRYQEFLRRKVTLRKKISQALAYPLFLLAALVVILGVLFAFVMPRFVSMYANFDAKLPLPTQWLLAAVEHFPLLAMLLAATAAAGWYGWRAYLATPDGRISIDRWKLRAPLLGRAEQTATSAYFARSLATLLSGGTPLLEALQVVQGSFPNLAYAQRIKAAAERVLQGESFANAARAAELLPETALKMIQVGEKSGALDDMLFEIARFYEEVLENNLARIMSLIEPMLVALMGILIGGIIIVMYLPIFSLAEVIR
ncbi:MAG TPA: type II secretion system F family protein [Gallionellaceae bacterium]